MNKNKHIAVIGSGIAGLHTVRILSEKGFTVTLFEKNEELFSEASSIVSEIHGGAEYPPKRKSITKEAYQTLLILQRPKIYGEKKDRAGKFVGYWLQKETDFTPEQLQSGKDCLIGLVALDTYDQKQKIFGPSTYFYIAPETEKLGEITAKRMRAYLKRLDKEANEIGLIPDSVTSWREILSHNLLLTGSEKAYETLQSNFNIWQLFQDFSQQIKKNNKVIVQTNFWVERIIIDRTNNKYQIISGNKKKIYPQLFDGIVCAANYQGFSLLQRSLPDYHSKMDIYVALREIVSLNIGLFVTNSIFRKKLQTVAKDSRLYEISEILSQHAFFVLMDSPGFMGNLLWFKKLVDDIKKDTVISENLHLAYQSVFYHPDKNSSWIDKKKINRNEISSLEKILQSMQWKNYPNNSEDTKHRAKNILLHVARQSPLLKEFFLALHTCLFANSNDIYQVITKFIDTGVFTGYKKIALSTDADPNKRTNPGVQILSQNVGMGIVDANFVTKGTTGIVVAEEACTLLID